MSHSHKMNYKKAKEVVEIYSSSSSLVSSSPSVLSTKSPLQKTKSSKWKQPQALVLHHFSSRTHMKAILLILSQLITAAIVINAQSYQLINTNVEDVTRTKVEEENIPSSAPAIEVAGRLLIICVANDITSDAFKRFNNSVQVNELDLIVLETNSDPNRFKQEDEQEEEEEKKKKKQTKDKSKRDKIDLVRKALATYKNDKDLAVIVVNEGENIILNGNKTSILSRFLGGKFSSNTRIVFGSDGYLSQRAAAVALSDDEQESSNNFNTSIEIARSSSSSDDDKKQHELLELDGGLNSAVYIGFAPSIWQLLNLNLNYLEGAQKRKHIGDKWEEYYTEAYLSETLRKKLGIQLDQRSELFHSLSSQEKEKQIELKLRRDNVRLVNVVYGTEPLILSANGPSKVLFNSLGNYLAKSWTIWDGCRQCNESFASLASTKDENLPIVLVGLFIEEATPFFDDFLASVYELDYPRDKIHLFIHSSIEYHDEKVENFIKKHSSEYASQQVIKSYSNYQNGAENNATTTTTTNNNNNNKVHLSECEAREYALDRCKELRCDYYLSLDSVARIDLPNTLKSLIEANKSVVGPLLSRPGKLWSNFWGSISHEGFYQRSFDYVEILKGERTGIWNVAHLMNAYLVEGSFIRRILDGRELNMIDESNGEHTKQLLLSYCDVKATPNVAHTKPALTFSRNLRRANKFMFMLNTQEFGHLVDPTTYNISRKHPDFYQLEENTLEWESNYLHENYSRILESDFELEKPCPDVIWFPLVSERFCRETIEIMENFGQWSSGKNHDPRIEGGYESVPTRDIHFKQVGLHDMWLTFLRDYVTPIQLKEYIGYEHIADADLAFVVRYHPQEQDSLQPHHDSSTFTLNIALNSPNVDYEGGGCRFLRYNCSVTESRRGWGLIHPGRLTHYHEGLRVTKGTRYILVTFVDP